MLGADADYLEPDQILSEYTIPFGGDYIVDAGRWIRKPESHDSIEDALVRHGALLSPRTLVEPV